MVVSLSFGLKLLTDFSSSMDVELMTMGSDDNLLRDDWAAFLSFGFKPLMDFGTSMKVQLDTVGKLLTLEAAYGYRWHQLMSFWQMVRIFSQHSDQSRQQASLDP